LIQCYESSPGLGDDQTTLARLMRAPAATPLEPTKASQSTDVSPDCSNESIKASDAKQNNISD
jgi:hypothetical protein